MIIPTNVLEVLSRMRVDGRLAFIEDGQLPRKLYLATNKVLEEMGGEWHRGRKAHVFLEDPTDVIDRTILAGEITTKAELGFFETPPDLADRVVALALIRPTHLVLEPSAGHGALAVRAEKQAMGVDCIEFDEKRAALLRTTLGGTKGFGGILCGDFLAVPPKPQYDRVVMNPPFARQQDIAHVQHAYKFLKPGGRLVAIASAGVTFRADRKTAEFQDFFVGLGGDLELLPPGAFKSSGTNVRTALLTIEKPS